MTNSKTRSEVREEAPTFVGAPKAPREASPIQGDVDVSEMAKRVLARFPKIIAKLAE
jgi:hypothetical protein